MGKALYPPPPAHFCRVEDIVRAPLIEDDEHTRAAYFPSSGSFAVSAGSAPREPPCPGRTIRSSRGAAGAGDQGRFSSGLRPLASVKPLSLHVSPTAPKRARACSSNRN